MAETMQAVVKPSVIENSALQKFKLTVLSTSLVFFPVWRFLIRDKESTSERDLCIDGLKGQAMTLSRPQTAQKRK